MRRQDETGKVAYSEATHGSDGGVKEQMYVREPPYAAQYDSARRYANQSAAAVCSACENAQRKQSGQWPNGQAEQGDEEVPQ